MSADLQAQDFQELRLVLEDLGCEPTDLTKQKTLSQPRAMQALVTGSLIAWHDKAEFS